MEKYKIEELIGEGSYGSVYRVRNDQGQVFAYKRIKVDPFLAEETEREIDIMRKLHHPNLLKVYEHHFEDKEEELRIIMQYCEGGDLSQFIKKNKNIPAKTTLSILQQIVSAFIVMSAKGVIHRDLKPQNILLAKDFKVIKIADFGCAKEVDINNISRQDSRSMEKGTYLYISPQQLKMEKYSFKCDVWAAGCIAYLLQYGYHPFIQANPHNVLIEINKKALERPIQVLSETDSSIAAFIHLTLLYEDIERASWRQLQLCRIFAPKISSVEKYINYLRTLSPLANAIVKEFWKIHKSFKFPYYLDQVLIYYLIKFQMNNLKMCLRLFKKMESYGYLFDRQTYENYQPKEEAFNEVKKSYLEYEKYFTTIKKTIEAKECFAKFIAPYEPKRVSSFADLDKSIRTGYKILRWVKEELREHPLKDNRSWVLLGKWINFESWFSFQKQFSLEKLSSEPVGDVMQQINKALALYEMGSVG